MSQEEYDEDDEYDYDEDETPEDEVNEENEENKNKSDSINSSSRSTPTVNNNNDNESTTSSSTILSNNSKQSRKLTCMSLSEELNFKKVKRNQYSSKFVKFQMSLTDLFSNQSMFVYFSNNNNNNNTNLSTTGPNLQVNNHSNKSTVSSLLAASELSKQQNSSNNNNNNNANSDNNNNKIQFSKRGSIKEIVKNDCIKLVKINSNNSNNKTNTLFCRIKASQNIEHNKVIGEYIGKVMLADECINQNKNPFVSFYKLDLNETTTTDVKLQQQVIKNEPNLTNICIDASSIGNITRFVRKSCASNCKLKHIVDTNRNLRFIIVSLTNIAKGAEITLPLDFEDNEEQSMLDFNYILCKCQKEKCSLRDSIAKHTANNNLEIETNK